LEPERVDDWSAEDEQLPMEVIQKMTGAQRWEHMLELNRAAEERARARIRAQHPGATDREVFLRLAERRLGRELALRAFPELADLKD
jgi:hypothetical protein